MPRLSYTYWPDTATANASAGLGEEPTAGGRSDDTMTCRQCGTEIAEKALICYRCGTATTEPRVRPPALKGPRRSPLLSLIALLALVLAGLFMSQAAYEQVPPAVGYAVAALATIALVWRLAMRR